MQWFVKWVFGGMSLYLRNRIWWVCLVDGQGQTIRKTTRTTSKREAKRIHDQLKTELRRKPPLTLNNKQPRLQDAVTLWLEHAKGKATFERDKRVLEFFVSKLSHMNLADIRLLHIQQALQTKPNMKPSSINVYLAIIKAVLRRSERVWELIDRTPHIELLPNRTRRIRFITSEEAKRLLGELPAHLRDMVEFSLLTGLRKANVVGLCWEQVDLERGMAWIHADQSKSRQPIAVPLNTQALALLKRRKDSEPNGFGRVFTYQCRPIQQTNTKAFRAALGRAGIQNFRWHDLRHTWASWHIQSGTPIHILQELGGWHSYAMVKRYAHLTGEHLMPFVNNIDF